MKKDEHVKRWFVRRIIIIMIVLMLLLFAAKKFTGNVIGIDKKVDYTDKPVDIEEMLASLAEGLGSDTAVQFDIYSYDKGEMISVGNYAISDGIIHGGIVENPDISIKIHSKYFSEQENICSLIQKAMHNGDATITLNDHSVFSLMKYERLIECLGL